MSVGTMLELLAGMPRDYELTVCDVQGNDWPILAVTDGGEENAAIIDLGTQDDVEAAEEWPLGWDHV
jgi:hypothetical protein